MRNPDNAFHLAIPCRDLDETVAFYTSLAGVSVARRYDDRVTFNFFGDQVVCHLDPEQTATAPTMYPRHFGVTFLRRYEFDGVHDAAVRAGLPFFRERFLRFRGRREEHVTFMLVDPSNNVLEFKHYNDSAMMY